MKNIFSYATRELSQDAFLRWIFENHDCEDIDVRNMSRKLLKEFAGIDHKDHIKTLKTKAQWYRMDIAVLIQLENKEIAIFIEDKTSSILGEEQLTKYNENINKINKKGKYEEVYKIFYKTDTIEFEERQLINAAKWETYAIDDIVKLFNEFENSNNLILKSYIENINYISYSLSYTDKPIDNKNLHMWKSFFNNVVNPKIEDICSTEIAIGWYGYTYLAIIPHGYLRKTIPYLEVRSRDCIEKHFKSRILLHGIEDKKKLELYKQHIQDKIKIRDTLFTFSNRGTMLAGYSKPVEVEDVEGFVIQLRKCIVEYIEIIESCDLIVKLKKHKSS